MTKHSLITLAAAAALAALPAPPAGAQEEDVCIVYDFAGSRYCVVEDTLATVENPPAVTPPHPDHVTPRLFTVAAAGAGATYCTIRLDKKARDFFGQTACSTPVKQTAQAFASGGATASGSECSGTFTICASWGWTTADFTTLTYRMTIEAPPGQRWTAPLPECSGSGTAQLDCTFVY
jgi:hypothetical protein